MPSPNEYKALAEEGTVVAAPKFGASAFFKLLVPLGAVAFAGWMLYAATRAPDRPLLTASDGEDFHTTQFPAPSLDTPRPQLDNGTIKIPATPEETPAVPLQPPTTIQAPPLPPPLQPPTTTPEVQDDSEARRLAEEERRRQEEEERQKWERLRAKQVVVDSGDTSGNASTLGGNQTDAASAGNAGEGEEDPNRRFLARASQSGTDTSKATMNPRTDALVAQGTMIKGVLETAIESDLAGMVRAVVSEDVWSFDGRRVLIPGGSRLIGEYRSGLATGQTRVFIVWTRLLRSDGVSVQLGSTGTDDLGRSGMPGEVDNHYVQRFGSAILLSVVGGATQFIANLGSDQNASNTNQTYTDPTTGQTVTIQTQPNQYMQNARQIGAQQISQSLNNIAQEALRNSINIPPTINVDQGARIMVFVRRDLDFSEFYPDPVREALREIKLERAAKNRISK
ncbi:type IV secretion system protein VirB10 [Rhizobium sp. NXC24]|uniref:type IV secretion system protein VirB10 n=1 Tax=Rhizobium sp. NXC24 TaxID=2048897 RepID=UPI000CDF461A|nr:type IV secretion system protein VirB10 [Rhizobium sp. NXC24]AVA23830.1 type IV secretion system TrbI/VirB10 family protein [Rhizobium sp. NXC24]